VTFVVAPAFRRALWSQADARLKAGATRGKAESSRMVFWARYNRGIPEPKALSLASMDRGFQHWKTQMGLKPGEENP